MIRFAAYLLVLGTVVFGASAVVCDTCLPAKCYSELQCGKGCACLRQGIEAGTCTSLR